MGYINRTYLYTQEAQSSAIDQYINLGQIIQNENYSVFISGITRGGCEQGNVVCGSRVDIEDFDDNKDYRLIFYDDKAIFDNWNKRIELSYDYNQKQSFGFEFGNNYICENSAGSEEGEAVSNFRTGVDFVVDVSSIIFQSIEIINDDGEAIFQGCPAEDEETGEVGILDTVSGNFYTNSDIALECSDEEPVQTFTINYDLNHTTVSNPQEFIDWGESYQTGIDVEEGCTLEYVLVYMGDEDITETAYNPENGEINIDSVSGEIGITAYAESEPTPTPTPTTTGNVYIGSTQITNIYLGSEAVVAMYMGSVKVFPSVSPTPTGVTRLKYMETDGNSFVYVTDAVMPRNAVVRAQYMKFFNTEKYAFTKLLDNGDSSGTNVHFQFLSSKYEGFLCQYGHNNSEWKRQTVGIEGELQINHNGVYVDGEQFIQNVEGATQNAGTGLGLFNSLNNPSSGDKAINGVRLGTVEIYNADGTIACRIYPALDAEGTPCFYNETTGEFYYNSGSGTLSYAEYEAGESADDQNTITVYGD